MEDGVGAAPAPVPVPVPVSRQQLFEAFVGWYVHASPRAPPCRDARLLRQAERYLAQPPGPAQAFTLFPFREALRAAGGAEPRRDLRALVRAAELLETLSINVLLQPRRREFRTLKSFTGPFVYYILPALSSSTVESVLASIGYLPHADAALSEYRLCADVDSDRAALMGFELLLARVQALQLLEHLEKDQLGLTEWLDLHQRNMEVANTDTLEKMKGGQKEEEKKKEVAQENQVPLCLDVGSVKPAGLSRHLSSMAQSIMELQMTYPDLAIRGRPLLQDKASSRFAPAPGTNQDGDARAAQRPHRSSSSFSSRATRAEAAAADAAVSSSKEREMLHGRSSSSRNADGSEAENQDVSMHITLRAAAAESSKKKASHPELLSPALTAPQQEATELVGLIENLHLHQTSVDQRRTKHNQEEEEEEGNVNSERRKRGAEASSEGGAEKQDSTMELHAQERRHQNS